MATLLLELFSEEIPSRMQRSAAEQLQRLVSAGLEKSGLKVQKLKTFVSPRHLAIQVFDLPLVQPDVREERKGPKVGAPEQAMKGFLGATGLTVEQCEQRDGYYYATIERKGQATAAVVKTVVEDTLAAFGWPKSMHWGSRDTRPLAWVRPLHRIVCLLDADVVPVKFAHLTASNVTEGHRFLAPEPITLNHADQYEGALKAANVVVDYAARRALIADETKKLAEGAKLTLVQDEALLDEVTGLVEWPVPLLGEFDAKFLELPPEVLISEMKVHQRYFGLRGADGKLSNTFIAVANMVTADGGKRVIAGNARVLRARLSDGEFYWEQDQKTSLEDWGKKLIDVVFHKEVGMMDVKVKRIGALAEQIALAIGFKDMASVGRAARLCKADLTSGMVGEFPELQGIMGRYYATAQKESAEVADAIRDHYKPLGANDTVPETELAAIIAVADKLDSIVSLFAAGEKPTGSKDPLALRRAALGILRILIAKGYSVNIRQLVNFSLENQAVHLLADVITTGAKKIDALDGDGIPTAISERAKKEFLEKSLTKQTLFKQQSVQTQISEILSEVADFFRDRLQNLMREQGVRHDIIEASFLAADKGFNPIAILAHTKDLTQWLASPAGKDALAATKRVLNILAAEEKKAKTIFAADSKKSAGLKLPVEQKLQELIQSVNNTKLSSLEMLTVPINQFFDEVLVTEPEFRDARLALLAGVRDAASSIADFSKIEG